MILAAPDPVELLRVARKVVWYDSPEETLADLPTFLAQVMVYASVADVDEETWRRWHERFGMPAPPLPRRRFPDGSVGPEAGRFFGR